MPDPIARIEELGLELLDIITDTAVAHGHDLPARRQLGEGLVAWDCPMVCVNVAEVYRGRPGNEAPDIARASDTYVAAYGLWVIRGATMPKDDGRLPTGQQVTTSAGPILRDAWLLTAGIHGPLRQLEQRCTALRVGRATAQGPEGGLAGWRALVEVAL